MAKKPKTWPAAMKSKVALTTIKGDLTIAQISSKFEVHATQISRWRKQLVDGAPEIFQEDRKKTGGVNPDKELIEQLYRQIGQLSVENDWLKKKSEEIFN